MWGFQNEFQLSCDGNRDWFKQNCERVAHDKGIKRLAIFYLKKEHIEILSDTLKLNGSIEALRFIRISYWIDEEFASLCSLVNHVEIESLQLWNANTTNILCSITNLDSWHEVNPIQHGFLTFLVSTKYLKRLWASRPDTSREMARLAEAIGENTSLHTLSSYFWTSAKKECDMAIMYALESNYFIRFTNERHPDDIPPIARRYIERNRLIYEGIRSVSLGAVDIIGWVGM